MPDSSQAKNYGASPSNEQKMEDLIRREDAGLEEQQRLAAENGDPRKSKDWLLGPITDMISYDVDKRSLDCPELEDNPIFIKLKNRILKFFITREETRRYGPSAKQAQSQLKQNIDYRQWEMLHRSLKKLVREVIRC